MRSKGVFGQIWEIYQGISTSLLWSFDRLHIFLSVAISTQKFPKNLKDFWHLNLQGMDL